MPRRYGSRQAGISRFNDLNDPVSNDADDLPSSPSRPLQSSCRGRKRLAENIESTPTLEPNKKSKRTTTEDEDGARLFGDSWRDDESVAIPVPENPRQSHKSILNGSSIGGLQVIGHHRKRINPLLNPAFHQSPPSKSGRPRQPPVFSSRQASIVEVEPEVIDPRPNKRQKQRENIDMSREEPIIVPDDDDSVHLSSTPPEQKSNDGTGHIRKKPPQVSPTANRALTRSIPLDEYNGVEAMMNPKKAFLRPSKDQQAGGILHIEHEGQFTKMAPAQLRQDTEDRPKSRRSNAKTVSVDIPAREVRSTFTATDGKQRNSRLGSPDVLQGDVTVGRAQSPDGSSSRPTKRTVNRWRDPVLNGDGVKQLKQREGYIIYRMDFARIPIPDNEDYMVSVEKEGIVISSLGSRLSQDPICTIQLSAIYQMRWGGRYILLNLRCPPEIAHKAWFILHTEKEVWNFARRLERIDPGIKMSKETEDWMSRALESHDTKRDRERAEVTEASQITANTILDGVHRRSQPHRTMPQAQIEGRATANTGANGNANPTRAGSSVGITFQEAFENALRPRKPSSRRSPEATRDRPGEEARVDVMEEGPRRYTRASTGNSTAHVEKHVHQEEEQIPFSQTGGLGPEWKKPLTYPKIGKKRAEVEFRDLERLDDNEFLNDNLIEFFLRFLEVDLQQHRSELAKKVYFFNTYFFATLTNPTRTKKGINYEGVQKWTRGTNLFEHDFIVVPINENAHWYVAIICNLPKLLPGSEDLADDQAVEENHNSSPPPDLPTRLNSKSTVENIDEPSQTSSVSELLLLPHAAEDRIDETNRTFKELNIADSESKQEERSDVNATGSLLSKWVDPGNPKGPVSPQVGQRRPGRSKKAARRSGVGLQKYDVKAPMIITMDSLGLGRSPTTKALRDYIVEEALAKLDLEIDGQQIRGMTAKGIPNQENYSDCGLFLLAYMEKFILDPYGFVGSILERKMDEAQDWPVMESHDLRNRLRHFLLTFHKAQNDGDKGIPDVPIGRILLGEPRRKSPIDNGAPSTETDTISKYFERSSSPQITKVRSHQSEAPSHNAENGMTADKELKAQQDSVITVESESSSIPQTHLPKVPNSKNDSEPDILEKLQASIESGQEDKGSASNHANDEEAGSEYPGEEVPESVQGGDADDSFDELQLDPRDHRPG